MNKWTNLDQYRKLYRFIGKRSAKIICIGIVTGMSLFAVEVTFAYLLQAFLVVIKIVPAGATLNFPSWLPTENVYSFLMFLIAILLARGLIRWLHAYLISLAYETQRDHQRKRLIEWVFSTRTVSAGEVITLYNNGIESVCGTLVSAQNIAIILSTSILLFVYLTKMSILITAMSVLILGIIAISTKTLNSVIVHAGRVATDELELTNRLLISNIKNLLLIQIYGTQQKEKTSVENHLNLALVQVIKYLRILNLKSALPQTMGSICICVICVFSTRKSWIPSGLMITYFYLFLQFVQNFSEVIKLFTTMSFSLEASSKFAKWWADHSYDGVRNQYSISPKIQSPHLEESIGWKFKNVSFFYPETTQKIVSSFTASIPAKSCTVIIGESGSGKSTILSLALGLYEPTSGSIDITFSSGSARPLLEVKGSLLRSIGYVGPESFLIEGTVRQNLQYGLETTPSDLEIENALATADCQFVNQLPLGLEHMISEQGTGLSAGQKQRLSFARALLRNPKVLILDESTSNLDVETEQKLVGTLEKLKGKVTILAVTHRTALLSIADQIIKLEGTNS